MKILRRGIIPEERVHQASCNHCGTRIAFQQKEATLVPDQRDGDFLTIPCPVCNRAITKAVAKTYNPHSFSR